MKIAIIGHKTSNLTNSRGRLIEAFLKKNYEVVAIGNEDIDVKKIKNICKNLLIKNIYEENNIV